MEPFSRGDAEITPMINRNIFNIAIMKRGFIRQSLSLFAIATTLTATANELTLSYAEGSQTTVGTQKTETYDVGVGIQYPECVGAKITSIKVPLTSDAAISDVKVWVSKDLTMNTVDGKKVFTPDVVYDATVSGDYLTFTFPEPYTITEELAYVGYSFTVDNITTNTKTPVAAYKTVWDNALWIHSSTTYRTWKDYTAMGYSSAMTITLSGDFKANDASIAPLEENSFNKGVEIQFPVTIVSHGTNAISSFDYTYNINGTGAYSGRTTLDTPTPAGKLNYSKNTYITIPAINNTGKYNLEVAITKVNGAANTNAQASATGVFSIVDDMPVHRPVMEEHTGLWCGYCVRGFAAMKYMSETYPDDFIAISYHNDGRPSSCPDYMEIMSSSNFPNAGNGYPYCYLDRVIGCDPYWGTQGSGFGIEKDWKARRDVETPASIYVKANWHDAYNKQIDVETSVNFVKAADGEYQIAYALLANDLYGSGTGWNQINYYNTVYDASAYIPQMRQFLGANGASSTVSGLHFDDVVILAPDVKGVSGSLPSSISVGDLMTHKYTFNAENAVNTRGTSLVQNVNNLYVVAMLKKVSNGEIVNAYKCHVGNPVESGVQVAAQDEVVKVEYFDLTGRRVAEPVSGIYIMNVVRESGASESHKILVR